MLFLARSCFEIMNGVWVKITDRKLRTLTLDTNEQAYVVVLRPCCPRTILQLRDYHYSVIISTKSFHWPWPQHPRKQAPIYRTHVVQVVKTC